MRREFGRCIGLSFRIAPTVLAGAALILGFGPAPLSAQDSPGVAVIVGSAAPELERFAAQELCDYLAKLYGIQAHPSRQVSAGADPVFLIGSPETNASVRQALGESGFGKVTDQGLVLKRTRWKKRPALIVGGGSPRATLWAVYELVERWGVRYLTDRDVLPERAEEFQLPDLDVTMEPVFRIRAHPTIQDFACSGEAWGIADFRVLLNQLSKMKFSRVNIYPFGYQPYLHWKSKRDRAPVRVALVRLPLPDHAGHGGPGTLRGLQEVLEPGPARGRELPGTRRRRRAAGPQPDRACPPARTGNQQLCGHHAVPSGIRPPAERCPEGSATRSTDGGSGCLDAGGRSPLP